MNWWTDEDRGDCSVCEWRWPCCVSRLALNLLYSCYSHTGVQSPGLHPDPSCYLGSRDGRAGHLEPQKRNCLQWLHPKLSSKLKPLIPGGLCFFTSKKIVTSLNGRNHIWVTQVICSHKGSKTGWDSRGQLHSEAPARSPVSPAPVVFLLCTRRCAECQTYRRQTDSVFVMLHLLQTGCGSKASSAWTPILILYHSVLTSV